VFLATLRSSDPLRPDCKWENVSHSSYVTLVLEGTTWVIRSESTADGDLELRFVEKQLLPPHVEVSGTAQGTSRGGDLSTMTFRGVPSGGSALLTGGTDTSPRLQIAGSIRGLVTADFPLLGSGECAQAEWLVRKPEECEITRTCN
jgi:hypothetical protein